MSRQRLTNRRKQAVDGPPNQAYPGTVNQPDREFKDWEEYHNFIQNINHELPDMSTDWRDDERDDIGLGIPEAWGESPVVPLAPGTKAPTVTAPSSGDMAPTLASARIAASKAVKLAVLLLGEKVAEDVIEEQSNDFMMISEDILDRTLARFQGTQELYASDDEDDDSDEKEEAKEASEKVAEDDEKEEAEESKEAAEKGKIPPQFLDNVKKKKEEAKDSKEEDSKESSEKVAASEEETKEEDSKEEDSKEETKEATDKIANTELSNQLADDIDADGSEVTATAEDNLFASSEMDIELSASSVDTVQMEEGDSVLASLFSGDVPEELPEPTRQASKKQGIKSLGGQPKVASSEGAADISSLWGSAPDVSEVFN